MLTPGGYRFGRFVALCQYSNSKNKITTIMSILNRINLNYQLMSTADNLKLNTQKAYECERTNVFPVCMIKLKYTLVEKKADRRAQK